MSTIEWVNAKDELPQQDSLYLVCCGTADSGKPLITTAWYDPDFGWSLLPEAWMSAISHWMELPEPPSGH